MPKEVAKKFYTAILAAKDESNSLLENTLPFRPQKELRESFEKFPVLFASK